MLKQPDVYARGGGNRGRKRGSRAIFSTFTDVGLEEYSGELCRISLNSIFGGAQYRTVKVRSEKEKKQNEYFGGYYK